MTSCGNIIRCIYFHVFCFLNDFSALDLSHPPNIRTITSYCVGRTAIFGSLLMLTCYTRTHLAFLRVQMIMMQDGSICHLHVNFLHRQYLLVPYPSNDPYYEHLYKDGQCSPST